MRKYNKEPRTTNRPLGTGGHMVAGIRAAAKFDVDVKRHQISEAESKKQKKLVRQLYSQISHIIETARVKLQAHGYYGQVI